MNVGSRTKACYPSLLSSMHQKAQRTVNVLTRVGPASCRSKIVSQLPKGRSKTIAAHCSNAAKDGRSMPLDCASLDPTLKELLCGTHLEAQSYRELTMKCDRP